MRGADPAMVDAYFTERRAVGYAGHVTGRVLQPLASYLRRLGVVPPRQPRIPHPNGLTKTWGHAAVASIAYFALRPGRIDLLAAALAGYGLLMVLAQLPLLPIYLRLRFALSTWAFTFSWAAVASTALLWIGATHPAGHRVYSYLVLGVISVFIGAIAARTGLTISRRQLLPAPAPPAAAAAATPSPSAPSPATGQPGVPPVAARPSGTNAQNPTQPLGRG